MFPGGPPPGGMPPGQMGPQSGRGAPFAGQHQCIATLVSNNLSGLTICQDLLAGGMPGGMPMPGAPPQAGTLMPFPGGMPPGMPMGVRPPQPGEHGSSQMVRMPLFRWDTGAVLGLPFMMCSSLADARQVVCPCQGLGYGHPCLEAWACRKVLHLSCLGPPLA
jgi:hypothetical protein